MPLGAGFVLGLTGEPILDYAKFVKKYHSNTTAIVHDRGTHNDPYIDCITGADDADNLTAMILDWGDKGFTMAERSGVIPKRDKIEMFDSGEHICGIYQKYIGYRRRAFLLARGRRLATLERPWPRGTPTEGAENVISRCSHGYDAHADL